MTPATRVVFGAMTGTSLDGLDAAAISWSIGALERPRLLGVVSTDLGACREVLASLCEGEALSASVIASASSELSSRHVIAFEELRAQVGEPDLIAVHGQTVFHRPPRSWQLLNPWPIASAFGVPLVSDLRGLDLAESGEGAPITPLSDLFWFGEHRVSQVVVNLGGFANATVLPASGEIQEVEGFDICACNHVLNAGARRALGEAYDRDGVVGARGKPIASLAERLATQLRAQASGGRSLGTREDLTVDLFGDTEARPEDLLASAAHAVATIIGERVSSHTPGRVILAGGGAKNRTLFRAIAERVSCPAVASSDLGVPLEAREAAAIATLGALAAEGRSITLPGVTRRASKDASLVDGLWCLARTNADGPGVWRPR
ncbi:MAG: anhydro-N-acetylmuramic acid kinase [Phycisphaerales bacterium]